MKKVQLRSAVLQASQPKNQTKTGGVSNSSTNAQASNTISPNALQNNQTIQRTEAAIPSGDSTHVTEEKTIPGSSAQVCEHAGDPVNMATGALIYEDNDFALADIKGDFLLTRRYTSQKDQKYRKSLGKIWSFSIDTAITRDGAITTVTLPDSKTIEFTYEEQQYKNTRGGTEAYTLIKPEAEFILTDHKNQIKYIYSDAGTIQKTIDHNGNTTHYTYTDYGIDTIQLATGLRLTFQWKDMKVTKVSDNIGRTVQYSYENGRLTQVTRCDGTEITYGYDENENLIHVTDALGCTYLTNEYDEHRRVTRQHLADGSCFSYTYQDKERTNTFTDETSGTTITYEYDHRFDITKITYPDQTETITQTDIYGNISKKIDRCGAVWAYTYDKQGNRLTEQTPTGLIIHHEYRNNHLVQTYDNTKRQRTYAYDNRGNLITERIRMNSTTNEETEITYSYDEMGRIIKQTENNTIITEYQYTGTNPNPTTILYPDETVETLNYDGVWRVIATTKETVTNHYTYTAFNQIQTETDGEGGITRYYYDAAWRLIKKTNPVQTRTKTIEDAGETYEYDSLDRLIAITDACHRRTEYERNSNGDIIRERKCGNNRTEEETISYEYDSNHYLVKKQIGSYGAERYEHDACGRMITRTPMRAVPSNEITPKHGTGSYRYERDGAGRIKSVTDPYGVITDEYQYDVHNNVICHIHTHKKTDSNRQPEHFGDLYTYNTIGLMTSKYELVSMDETGNPLYAITQYQYDNRGNLSADRSYTELQPYTDKIKGECRTVTRNYDACGRLTRITDGIGGTLVFTYDKQGLKIREAAKVDANRELITEYRYDNCARLVERKKYKAEETKESKPTFERKSGNRFLQIKREENGTASNKKEANEPTTLLESINIAYDASGQVIEIRESEGRTLRYTYDLSGNPTAHTVTATNGTSEAESHITYAYDRYGYCSKEDRNGVITEYENDAFGNMINKRNPDGGTAVYAYDGAGRCIQSISPNEYAQCGANAIGTRFVYDLCGRPVTELSPEGIRRSHLEYAANGKLYKKIDADGGFLCYTYDQRNHITGIESAAGVRQTYSYNALGTMTSSTLGGHTTCFETDVWGRVTQKQAPEGVVETYEYDTMGHVITTIDGEGKKRSYHREVNGLVDTITYEDGICEKFQYNSMGKMTHHTYRSGKQVSYRYDTFGNIVEKQGMTEPAKEAETVKTATKANQPYKYTYSKDGLLTTAVGGGITYHYTYDSSKRLAEKSACGRSLIRYSYDFNGNIKTITDPTGKTITYTYDLSDRLIAIRDQEKELAHYRYTNGYRVATITCGDIETAYAYDLDGNTRSITISISKQTISQTRYAYDQSGNCITKEYALNERTLLPTVKTEYTYDGLNRLIQSRHSNSEMNASNLSSNLSHSVVDETFTYDKAGNRMQRSVQKAGDVQTDDYSYGLLNELNSVTRRETNQSTNFSYDIDGNMVSDGRGIYCYDAYQQMTEARMEDGNQLVCRYDAEGLRYEMEENENLIQFIYSGRNVVYEESAQASSVRYIRGNGRMVASDVEHARTYYHYASDDLGSVTHLISRKEESVKESVKVDASRIVGCYDYDAFGNRIYEWEEVENRYGFAGEIYDRMSGAYYLRARYYCPEIGRFTQPDCYHGDGLNLYAYVGNNPVKYVDPSGHCSCGKSNGVKGGSDSSFIEKPVDLTGFRKDHILNNHKYGAGKPEKTEFPKDWNDEKILHYVSDVGTDPHSTWGMGKWNSPYAIGVRDGIEIRVDFYPDGHPKYNGKISTAYPLNTPHNPTKGGGN